MFVKIILTIIVVDIIKHAMVSCLAAPSMPEKPSQTITEIFMIVFIHKDRSHIRLLLSFKRL